MSDSTDLSIVLIIIVGYIIYIFYIKKIIFAKYDINNIKCNPVNLFLKSINADSADNINDFAECVQILNPNKDKEVPLNNLFK
jgi:hypothetical protein